MRKENLYSTNLVIFVICVMGVMAQFAADSYTPSLPSITKYFHASELSAKMTVGIYFLGTAIATLFFGYFSDKYGRKKILIIGYILFSVSTIFCFFATSEYELIAFRFIQGAAMASSLVSFRIIMKEVFKHGESLAKASLMISSVVSLTPPLAPLTGGLIQEYFGWRYNFLLMLVMALVTIFMIAKYLKLEKREIQPTNIIEGYKYVLKNKVFIINACCSGLALSTVFIFITLAPFLFQNILHYSAMQYSMVLPLIIIPPALLVMKLKNRIHKVDTNLIMIVCSIISFTGALLMAISYYIFGLSEACIIIFCIIIFSGNIFQFTSSYLCAYKNIDKHIGVCSSLYGFTQVAITSVVALAVARIHIYSQHYLGLIMCIPPIMILVLKIYNIRINKKLDEIHE